MAIELYISDGPGLFIDTDIITLESGAGTGTTGAAGADGESPTAANIGAVISAADVITDPTDAGLFGVAIGSVVKRISWANLYTRLRSVLLEILGQRETWQTHTATDAGTITLDYSAGNSHYIDATGMAVGETVAINVSNWPTYGTYNGIMTVVVLTGADILWAATGDYGNLLADIEVSKENLTWFSHKKGAATYLFQFVRAD